VKKQQAPRNNGQYTDTSIVGGYFGCVQMKNDIQAKIYAETKDMTFAELRTYLGKQLSGDALWQRITRQQETHK
jgi:hypothetical protein